MGWIKYNEAKAMNDFFKKKEAEYAEHYGVLISRNRDISNIEYKSTTGREVVIEYPMKKVSHEDDGSLI